jgi:ABC-type branched-subunit amino acid transport system ATPase component
LEKGGADVLEIEGLSKSFGGLMALWDVSFELPDVPVTGLIGPNGSGKSTLFHCITGFYRPDSGEILFRGRPLQEMPPHEINRAGLARTFQESRVLPGMSVLDNLRAVAPDQEGEDVRKVFFTPGRIRRREREATEEAERILDLLGLSHMTLEPAGVMSFGQQKLLEIGRVLMTRPSLVLLDEPTAGVNPTLILTIKDVVLKLADQGIRFFLVEHNMPLVAELCSHVFVMDSGRLIFSGDPAEARRDKSVIEAYLGKDDDAA